MVGAYPRTFSIDCRGIRQSWLFYILCLHLLRTLAINRLFSARMQVNAFGAIREHADMPLMPYSTGLLKESQSKRRVFASAAN